MIKTKSLSLLPCDTEILTEAISGNDHLAKKLGVQVPDNWTEFGTDALRYSLNKLSESEQEAGWWTYFPVHKQDQRLIGSGGYQGKPTEEGTVEIGYEIAPDYRGQGLATEMAKALVENAFSDSRVTAVLAHTLGHANPSTAVLEKCGFTKVAEIEDPDEGAVWRWELKRT